jgi:hypothetical protein
VERISEEIMATLQNYIDDTLRLLRDANNTYYSPTDINAWINRARRRRDRDTGINRLLVTFPLVVGQTTYSLTTVNANAFDVVGIVLIYSNIRVDLENPSYRDLAATYLSVVNYNDVPRGYAKYGPSNIIIGPPPNSAYSTEWDTLQTGPDLVNTTDVDPIPAPWTEPVPFMAASYGKMELGEQDDAKRFEDMYLAQTIEIMSSTRGMQVPDPYFTTGRRYGSAR